MLLKPVGNVVFIVRNYDAKISERKSPFLCKGMNNVRNTVQSVYFGETQGAAPIGLGLLIDAQPIRVSGISSSSRLSMQNPMVMTMVSNRLNIICRAFFGKL